MRLITEQEATQLIEEARALNCEGSKFNDPYWSLQVLFFSVGTVMLLEAVYSFVGGRINWQLGVGGFCQICLGLYGWGCWQRRKAMCALHYWLQEHASDATATFAKIEKRSEKE